MDFFNRLLHRNTSGGAGNQLKNPAKTPPTKASDSFNKNKGENNFTNKDGSGVLSSFGSFSGSHTSDSVHHFDHTEHDSPEKNQSAEYEEENFEDAQENKMSLTLLANDLDKIHLSTPGKLNQTKPVVHEFTDAKLYSPDVSCLSSSFEINDSADEINISIPANNSLVNSSSSSVEYIWTVPKMKNQSTSDREVITSSIETDNKTICMTESGKTVVESKLSGVNIFVEKTLECVDKCNISNICSKTEVDSDKMTVFSKKENTLTCTVSDSETESKDIPKSDTDMSLHKTIQNVDRNIVESPEYYVKNAERDIVQIEKGSHMVGVYSEPKINSPNEKNILKTKNEVTSESDNCVTKFLETKTEVIPTDISYDTKFHDGNIEILNTKNVEVGSVHYCGGTTNTGYHAESIIESCAENISPVDVKKSLEQIITGKKAKLDVTEDDNSIRALSNENKDPSIDLSVFVENMKIDSFQISPEQIDEVKIIAEDTKHITDSTVIEDKANFNIDHASNSGHFAKFHRSFKTSNFEENVETLVNLDIQKELPEQYIVHNIKPETEENSISGLINSLVEFKNENQDDTLESKNLQNTSAVDISVQITNKSKFDEIVVTDHLKKETNPVNELNDISFCTNMKDKLDIKDKLKADMLSLDEAEKNEVTLEVLEQDESILGNLIVNSGSEDNVVITRNDKYQNDENNLKENIDKEIVIFDNKETIQSELFEMAVSKSEIIENINKDCNKTCLVGTEPHTTSFSQKKEHQLNNRSLSPDLESKLYKDNQVEKTLLDNKTPDSILVNEKIVFEENDHKFEIKDSLSSLNTSVENVQENSAGNQLEDNNHFTDSSSNVANYMNSEKNTYQKSDTYCELKFTEVKSIEFTDTLCEAGDESNEKENKEVLIKLNDDVKFKSVEECGSSNIIDPSNEASGVKSKEHETKEILIKSDVDINSHSFEECSFSSITDVVSEVDKLNDNICSKSFEECSSSNKNIEIVGTEAQSLDKNSFYEQQVKSQADVTQLNQEEFKNNELKDNISEVQSQTNSSDVTFDEISTTNNKVPLGLSSEITDKQLLSSVNECSKSSDQMMSPSAKISNNALFNKIPELTSKKLLETVNICEIDHSTSLFKCQTDEYVTPTSIDSESAFLEKQESESNDSRDKSDKSNTSESRHNFEIVDNNLCTPFNKIQQSEQLIPSSSNTFTEKPDDVLYNKFSEVDHKVQEFLDQLKKAEERTVDSNSLDKDQETINIHDNSHGTSLVNCKTTEFKTPAINSFESVYLKPQESENSCAVSKTAGNSKMESFILLSTSEYPKDLFDVDKSLRSSSTDNVLLSSKQNEKLELPDSESIAINFEAKNLTEHLHSKTTIFDHNTLDISEDLDLNNEIDFDERLAEEAAHISEHIINISRELEASDSEEDINKTVISVDYESSNDNQTQAINCNAKTQSNISCLSKTTYNSESQFSFPETASIESYLQSMRSVLPNHLNQSEAGPITADELSTQDLGFQDGANLDLDFFTQVGNTEGVIRTSLTRDSLYVKFDPIVGALVSKVINDKFTMPPPSAPEEGNQNNEEKNERRVSEAEDAGQGDAEKTPGRSPALEAVQKLISLTPPPAANTPSSVKLDRVTSTPTSTSQKSASQDQLKKEAKKLEEIIRKREAEYELEISKKDADIQAMAKREAELLSRQAELEAELKAAAKREHELRKEAHTYEKGKKSLSVVMDEYEKTIAQLVAEKEEKSMKYEQEKELLMKERDTAMQHLNNMEIAFNDVHQKYERSKVVIEGMKKNEEELKKTMEEYSKLIKNSEEKYDTLKKHAVEQLESANLELDNLSKKHKSEMDKLRAMLKKAEIRVKSLEESLDQKTKENVELTAICDELINKVGGN